MARNHIVLGYVSKNLDAVPYLLCITRDADEAGRAVEAALKPDGWAAVEYLDGPRGHRKVNGNSEATQGVIITSSDAEIADYHKKLCDAVARIAELEKQLSAVAGNAATGDQEQNSPPTPGGETGATVAGAAAPAAGAAESSTANAADGKTSNPAPDGGGAETARGKGGDGKGKRT